MHSQRKIAVRLLVALVAVMLAVASPAAAQSKKSHKQKASSTQQQTASKVDLNTASKKDLDALPGVAPATAKKIIANRPYASVDDLKKAGVSQSTIEKIRPMATVSTGAAAQEHPSTAESKKSRSAKKQADESSTSSAATTPANQGTASSASNSTGATQQASQLPQSDKSSAAPSPGSGMVWVNLDSKVYHYRGDRWYGKTKHGKYMTEADAQKAGYRAAKNEKKKE